MDRSSFQKLFKEMYGMNPKMWNDVLTKSGKTIYSVKPAATEQNKETMSSKAFNKLMNIDYDKFKEFGKKQDAKVDRPKSIRIDNQTLQQARNNIVNSSSDPNNVEFVDSSAVEAFEVVPRDAKTKDVIINFKGGDHGYMYPSVPNNVANGLYAAPSKGSYVSQVIDQYSNINDPHVQEYIANGQ